MKAIVNEKYGSPDVLKLQEIEIPKPGENEVLVKVYAASLNAYDWHKMRADPFLVRLMGGGFFKPKDNILGADIAGKIEAVGKNVKLFKPGDEVFGEISESGDGGFAEYVCTTEKLLILKPAGMTFEEAAAVPMASLTALQGLRDKGEIQPGKNVLINGASGGVGTFAVQIAKAFGAEVTAVCSTGKMEMVRSIGADHIIDYTQEDFTKNGISYDLILAANGYHPLYDYKRSLSPNGRYVMTGGTGAQMFQAIAFGSLMSKSGNKKMGMLLAHPDIKDLTIMIELIETGKVKPIIDCQYSLKEVPDAMRYLEEGHAKGKIVISIRSE
jgi:NADPH:quinone reductase-like Zn-dependent oxidoreductase